MHALMVESMNGWQVYGAKDPPLQDFASSQHVASSEQ